MSLQMLFLIELGHQSWSLNRVESIRTFSVHLNHRVSKPRSARFLLCGPRPHLQTYIRYTNLSGYVHPWLWFLHMRTSNQLIITVSILLPKKKICRPLFQIIHTCLYLSDNPTKQMLIVSWFWLLYFLTCVFPYSRLVLRHVMFCIQQFKLLNLSIELFYDLLQPLHWLKTRRPAVKTNPMASKTEMVCWG